MKLSLPTFVSRAMHAAAVAAALTTAPAAHAAPTACAKDEETIFRCPATNDRTVAVCASQGFTAQRGSLQYRYGPADNAELTLPPGRDSPPRDSAVLGNVLLSGGGGSGLRFASGGYRYMVYSAVVRGAGAKAGVGVWQGTKQISNIRCRNAKAEIDVPRLEKAGFAQASEPFDLPE